MGRPLDPLLSVEDFLGNDAFQRWVKERRPEDQLFWEEWLARHPDQRGTYEQAVALFLVLQGKADDPAMIKSKTDQLVERIGRPTGLVKNMTGWRWSYWLSGAAVISLVFIWQFSYQDSNGFFALGKRKEKQEQQSPWKLVKNESNQPLMVLLPDRSSVLLSPESQLRFRTQSNRPLREVYLWGEGFFEVSKDPAKPFMVYTATLTTKVVGTSFQVRSYKQESATTVQVKTGKVSVSPVSSPAKTVLLTENEQASLNGKTEKVVKQLSKPLAKQSSTIITEPFAFEYTPVPDIFDQLEACYHMPVRYDRDLLKHCTFTGQLNDVPFLEKIRLICLTIEATYQVSDNQVVIQSRGCN